MPPAGAAKTLTPAHVVRLHGPDNTHTVGCIARSHYQFVDGVTDAFGPSIAEQYGRTFGC